MAEWLKECASSDSFHSGLEFKIRQWIISVPFYILFSLPRANSISNVKSNALPMTSYSLLNIFCVLIFISVFLDHYSCIAFKIIPVGTCGHRWTIFFPSATNEAEWLNNPCCKKDYTRRENLIYKLPFSCCVIFFSVQPFFCCCLFVCFLPFVSYSSCFACFPIFLWVPSYRVITALPFYLLLKQPLTPQGKANYLFLSCLPHKYLQKTLRIDIRTESARGNLANVREERRLRRREQARRASEKELRTVFALLRPNFFVLIPFSPSPAT